MTVRRSEAKVSPEQLRGKAEHLALATALAPALAPRVECHHLTPRPSGAQQLAAWLGVACKGVGWNAARTNTRRVSNE